MFEYPLQGAVVDTVLGQLSPIALTIAAGTEDPDVRLALRDSVAAATQSGAGFELDLQRCGPGTIVARVLAAGASRVGGSAEKACAFLSEPRYAGGLALFVSGSSFAAWTGATVPTVTAFANFDPNVGFPSATFTGYVGASRRVQLRADGVLTGIPLPVFVVEPFSLVTRQ